MMQHLRTIVGLCGLLLAILAWGCSGVDENEGQPAAAQSTAAEQLFASGFQLISTSFQQRVRPYVRIPKHNTCFGENLSPPLDWTEAPESTRSFALIAEDIDHGTGTWVHWVLYNIPAGVTGLSEGIPTTTDVLPDGITQGINDERQPGYYGPCPPPLIVAFWSHLHPRPTEPPHRWEFTLYALDSELGLAPRATKKDLMSAMEGHILAEATTMGKYSPPQVVRETMELKEGLTQTAIAGPSPTPGTE